MPQLLRKGLASGAEPDHGICRVPRHGALLRGKTAKPEMIRSAVEELLRYEGPVRFTARMLREEGKMFAARRFGRDGRPPLGFRVLKSVSVTL